MSMRPTLWTGLLAIPLLATPVMAQTSKPRDLDTPMSRTFNGSLTMVLSEMGRQGGVRLWVLPEAPATPTRRSRFRRSRRVTIKLTNEPLRVGIDRLAKQLNKVWKQEGKLVILLSKLSADPLATDTQQYSGKTLRQWRAQLLSSQSSATCREAAKALVKGGDHGLDLLLTAAADSMNYRASRAARTSLQTLGEGGVARLLKAYRKTTDSTRQRAVRDTLRSLGQVAAPALLKEVKQGTPASRAFALEVLVGMRPPPKGIGQAVVTLLDKPDLDPKARADLIRRVTSSLEYSSSVPLEDALTVWLRLLTDPESTARTKGVRGLGQLAGRYAPPRPSRWRRAAPPRPNPALEKTRPQFQAKLPSLIKGLKEVFERDGDLYVRREAAKSLGVFARIDGKVLTYLGDRLGSEREHRTRQALIDALGAMQDPKAVKPLLGALRKDPRLATNIGSTLGRLGVAAHPALIAATRDMTSAIVRETACRALGRTRYYYTRTKPTEVIAALKERFSDPETRVRRAALRALLGFGKHGEEAIVEAVSSTNADVRLEATRAITRGRLAKRVIPQLIKGLSDASPDMRAASVQALRAAGKDAASAAPGLIKLFKDPEAKVRGVAAGAFAVIPGDAKAVVPGLCELLNDMDYTTRRNAATALKAFGPKAALAVDRLVEMTNSGDPRPRAIGVEVLGSIGPAAKKKGLAALIQATRDPNSTVRIQAAAAIVSVAPDVRDTADVLFNLVEDESAGVRAAACTAYAKLKTIPKDHVEPLLASARNMLRERYTGRRAGCTLLARLARQDDRALKELIERASGSSRSSSEAARALVTVGAKALPHIIDLLKQKKSSTLRYAVESMKVDKSAIPSIKTLLASKDATTQRLGAQLASKLGKDAAPLVKELGALLLTSNADYTVRRHVVDTLKVLGDPGVVALATALKSPTLKSYYELTNALERLGPKAKAAVPVLIQALEVQPAGTRRSRWRSSSRSRAIVRVLQKIGSPAVPALIKALDSPNPTVRKSAATVLVGLPKPPAKAAPKLIAQLTGRNYDLIRGLAKMGAPILPHLKTGLSDANQEVVLGVLEVVARMGKVARPLVLDLLPLVGDRKLNWRVRSAIRKVGAGKAELPKIKEILADETNNLHEGALLALEGSGVDGVPLVKDLLNGPDLQLRAKAVNVAASLGKHAAPLVPELVEALAEPTTAYAAERALSRIGKPAVTALIGALGDAKWEVRRSVARALAAIGPKHIGPAKAALIDVLKNDVEARVRVVAAVALGKLKADPKTCVPLILKEWEASDPQGQTICASALLAYGDQAMSKFAKRLIKDLAYVSGDVRGRAARSLQPLARKLSDVDAKAAVKQLIEIADQEPDAVVRTQAIATLSRFGHRAESALPTLRKLMNDADRSVSAQARYAVRQIESEARWHKRRSKRIPRATPRPAPVPERPRKRPRRVN